VLAAPQSGSGKTVLTLGLIRALKNKGLRVVSTKLGPDDFWSMGKEKCASLLNAHSAAADIAIIEGVMGLFDGPAGAVGSTADFAEALGLPVILVIDASHMAQTVAATIHGLSTFRPKLTIAGVILNRVKSDRHEAILREKIALPVLGVMRQNDSLSMPSRHLGLVQAIENQSLEQLISDAAATVARETELDLILNLAAATPNQKSTPDRLKPLGQHIAIARDLAFSFIYPHILKSWREQGAELSFFSPLQNESPAKTADAVYLPGGYPELHPAQIAAASKFLAALRETKSLIYGECGGYMVLGESLTDAAGATHQMADLLPVRTTFASRKLQLGYRQLTPLGGPWTAHLRGHEFHYSTIVEQGPAPALFDATDAAGNPLGKIGQRIGQVMGSYAHIISEAPQ
jgi:cobyrinic acid a,c-diamide synthase